MIDIDMPRYLKGNWYEIYQDKNDVGSHTKECS